MDCNELTQAIKTLVEIDSNGWLSDLECEIARARNGPRDDLMRYPHLRYEVNRFASVASRLFDVPLTVCQRAAIEALLPKTRRGIALEILDQYEARAEEAELKAQASRKLATVGGRR